MTPPPEFDRFNRVMRWIIFLALMIDAALLVTGAVWGSFPGALVQVLLSLLGLAVGALLVHVALPAFRRHPTPTVTTLAALACSQVCYHVLVWSEWRTHAVIWRLWWMSALAAVTTTHILALRPQPGATATRLERTAALTSGIAGLMLMSLGLFPSVPASPGIVFWILLAPPALTAVAGSLLSWSRRRSRRTERRPMKRWIRVLLVTGTHVALFMAGVYFGNRTARAPNPFDMLPSALAGLTPAQVDRQVRSDLVQLRIAVDGLDELTATAEKFEKELKAQQQKERREYYTPEEEERIRAYFFTYLSHRSALHRLIATYASFQSVREEGVRARCFMVGYAAGVVAFEKSLGLVERYDPDPLVRKKLNEGDPTWGLEAGMFDTIRASVTSGDNIRMYLVMTDLHDRLHGEWEAGGHLPPDAYGWMAPRIRAAREYIDSNPVSRPGGKLRTLLSRMKEDVKTPVMAAQTYISTWIGDTRIVDARPLVTEGQILELEKRLQPGDILLERRNWFLSNAFLPGFWPHGALYVGRPEDLKRLGILDHPEVRLRLEEYRKPAEDGQPHTVIEAVSEGVLFNSLTHSMAADYVAVLRPRLPEARKAEAIARAFSHVGKPYDFEFDFFTSDKLVCTELVYRSYEGFLHFDLVRVMGRDTLPALEIVRKHARERNTGKQELDFVAFLDGRRSEGRAVEADEEAFCRSVDRDQAFQE